MREPDQTLRPLLRAAGEAITSYGMIGDGDRIVVAVSGGKDSATLAYLLRHLQSRAPVRFELAGVTVDGGWSDHPVDLIRRFCAVLEIPLIEHRADILGTLGDKLSPGDTPCSLCARLRRGAIYRVARREGFGTVALGHHADDLIETLLLNQLFNGQTKSMPPVLQADDGVTTVIRPLALAMESDIVRFATAHGFPGATCRCPAEDQEGLRRPQIKELVRELEQRFPGSRSSLMGAVTRLKETTLADPRWLPRREAAADPVPGPRPPPPPAPAQVRSRLEAD